MKNKRPLKGLVSALIALALISVGYRWYSSRPVSVDASVKYLPHFLHCSHCNYEQPYIAGDAGQPCPKCRNGKLRSTPKKGTESVSFFRDPFAMGLIGTIV